MYKTYIVIKSNNTHGSSPTESTPGDDVILCYTKPSGYLPSASSGQPLKFVYKQCLLFVGTLLATVIIGCDV